MAVEISTLADNLPDAVLAVGALGTAAYGVVDGLKLIPIIDLAGFNQLFTIRQQLKDGFGSQSRNSNTTGATPDTNSATTNNLDPLLPALLLAYGPRAMKLIKSQYRTGRSKGDLPTTLRQGVRIGFGFMDAAKIQKVAEELGLDATAAANAAKTIVATREATADAPGKKVKAPTAEAQNATARLEMIIDARIDAALVLADRRFELQAKCWATAVALAIAAYVGWQINAEPEVVVVVGLAAVPLAPIAKDLASAIQAATQALRAK